MTSPSVVGFTKPSKTLNKTLRVPASVSSCGSRLLISCDRPTVKQEVSELAASDCVPSAADSVVFSEELLPVSEDSVLLLLPHAQNATDTKSTITLKRIFVTDFFFIIV